MNVLSDIFHKTKKTFGKVKEKVEQLQNLSPDPVEVPQPAKVHVQEKVLFEISAGSVARATLVILGLLTAAYFLNFISDILVVFFVSFLLTAGMEPAIDYLYKKHIPRGVAVILFYILALAFLGYVVSTIFPILAKQISELAGRAGQVLANISQIPENSLPFSDSINHSISQFLTSVNAQELVNQIDSNLQVFAQQLFALGGNLWQFIHVISNGIINLILVLILGFFMTVEKHAIENFVLSLFPVKHSEYAADRIVAMKKKIGHWLRAMLILMLSIGVSVYIGLLILGVEYAAILAIIAGLLEVVPVLGPPLSLLLALPIVANQSGVLTLWVIGLYIVIQQLEGHILVPIIMKRVTGLSSIAVIFSLLVGARFLGIVGIILSIPVATMISMFLDDYLGKRKA
ncbi:MAG: AI-2E family transporter [Patescibacteria group bacterium]